MDSKCRGLRKLFWGNRKCLKSKPWIPFPGGESNTNPEWLRVVLDIERPDAMLICSANLYERELNPELFAIARAGAGYNNIPVEECTQVGIGVFNSHGANVEAFAKMKIGIRIVNKSRTEVVDDLTMTDTLDTGKVTKYVTDFPNETILKAPNVIVLPHIGAAKP